MCLIKSLTVVLFSLASVFNRFLSVSVALNATMYSRVSLIGISGVMKGLTFSLIYFNTGRGRYYATCCKSVF